MLKISLPKIYLREWTATDLRPRREAADRLRKLGQFAGQSSNRFKARCIALKRLADGGDQARITKALEDPIAARAYAYLLANDEEFAESAPPTTEHIKGLKAGQWPIRRLTLALLGRAYLQLYSKLADGPREAMGLLIHGALELLPNGKTANLAKWKKHANTLFTRDAPSLVVNSAISAGLDLDNHLRFLGLEDYGQSDFVFACRRAYYIRQLETLEVGADHKVLEELKKPSVHGAIYEAGDLIGHRALEILIDRTPASGPSDAWRRTVLSVAGDPRVGRLNQSYKKWWQILGDQRAAKVISWLSSLDLKIFLEVLENSARAKGQTDIQRMYPPRKDFMHGLLEQGLVLQSRLFLSRDALEYLKKNYKREDFPHFAQIRNGTTSMIYLELSNNLHMIEGTHSFKLKILDKMPSKTTIGNFAQAIYSDYDLRDGALDAYKSEARKANRLIKEGTNWIEEIHRPIHWQGRAIAFLKKNKLPVTAAKLLSKENYQVFKRTQPADLWT